MSELNAIEGNGARKKAKWNQRKSLVRIDTICTIKIGRIDKHGVYRAKGSGCAISGYSTIKLNVSKINQEPSIGHKLGS